MKFTHSYSFSNVNDLASLHQFLYNFILGKSSYHLYFIAVVIQFYLFFPFIQRFNSKKQLLLLTVFGLYINYFHIVAPLDIGAGMFNQLSHERAFLFNWIFYFFFGGLLVHLWKPIVEFIKKNISFIMFLGIISLSFIMYEYLSSDERILGSTRVANLINVPVLFFAFTGCYYALHRFDKLRQVFLAIGNMSMGIYLVHPLVIYFMREELAFLLEQTRWVPLGYIVTLFASILIVKLIHKLPFGHYVVIIAANRKKTEKDIRNKKSQ